MNTFNDQERRMLYEFQRRRDVRLAIDRLGFDTDDDIGVDSPADEANLRRMHELAYDLIARMIDRGVQVDDDDKGTGLLIDSLFEDYLDRGYDTTDEAVVALRSLLDAREKDNRKLTDLHNRTNDIVQKALRDHHIASSLADDLPARVKRIVAELAVTKALLASSEERERNLYDELGEKPTQDDLDEYIAAIGDACEQVWPEWKEFVDLDSLDRINRLAEEVITCRQELISFRDENHELHEKLNNIREVITIYRPDHALKKVITICFDGDFFGGSSNDR